MKDKNFEDNIKFNLRKDKKDRRDFRVTAVRQTVEVPKKHFDFVDTMPVKCQYSRGSCSSQGTAHHKEHQEEVELSAPFIMTMSKKLEGNKGEWGYTRLGQKVLHDIGVCRNELLPEPSPEMSWLDYIDENRITSEMLEDALNHKSETYWRVNDDANPRNNVNEIRQTLYEGKDKKRTVVLAMKWYDGFNNKNIKNTNFTIPKDRSKWGKYVGGHLVEVQDYDDYLEEFKSKNSWGNGWGDKGYFSIPYSVLNYLLMDCYTSLDLPKELPVDNRYGTIRTWSSFLREQAMAFNAWLFAQIGRLPNNREISALAYGYYPFDAVFRGSVGDAWLYMTYPEYKKRNGLLS